MPDADAPRYAADMPLLITLMPPCLILRFRHFRRFAAFFASPSIRHIFSRFIIAMLLRYAAIRLPIRRFFFDAAIFAAMPRRHFTPIR
jgi:hypothetical protein